MWNLLCWMTVAIETMLQHGTKGIVFSSILDPRALYHPDWVSCTFTTNLDKNRSARLVVGVIDKISLQQRCKVSSVTLQGIQFDIFNVPVAKILDLETKH